jgi:DNA polymerase-3 subunit delta'
MSAQPWHEAHWQRLQSRLARGALPHALLLCGPEGLGKRAFLQRFVRGLLCGQPQDGEACGQCRTCLLLEAGTHPDYMTVSYGLRKDGVQRKEIVVDQIRELSARLAMASQFGGWQIATIDPADALNAPAANALLKTLEEPAAQTMLVLIADAPWRLPQTIRSRCQRIEFHLPEPAQALAWLQAQGVADPASASALQAAGGNPGLAQRWAEEGALERRREVRRDLAALAAGRGETTEVVRRWLDSEPAQRVWFAAQAAADEARTRAGGEAGALGSVMDAIALADWYDRANRTRESLRGPLRGDLALLELLARWR